MTWLRNSLSVLGVATLASLAATGCEENESMLFIKGVLAIETTNCVAKPESGGTLKANGRVDTELANSYTAALLVGSQLTQRGSREQLRTETARLSLEGAEITLNDAVGNPLPIAPNPFTAPGTGFIDPAGGTNPGFGAIFVDIIPAGIMDAVAEAVGGAGGVQAKIRVFGTTLGGQAVESGDYAFSIEICNGCLISYPSGADGGGAGEDYTCNMPVPSSTTQTICALGQDQFVPCNLCAGTSDVCLHPCANCSIRADARNDVNCMNSPDPECP